MKTKLITLLMLLLPICCFSQNYEKEGDDLFSQAQYEQAEKKYNAALVVLGEVPTLKQKQEKCSKCKSLLGKARAAEKESRYSDAAKHYSELYTIHPLANHLSKANEMKQKNQRAKQAEQEREIERKTASEQEDNAVYVVVESMPEFPGGKAELDKYINLNLMHHVEGRSVSCQFIVEKDGSLGNVELISTTGDSSLDEEAIRVIKSMPKWKPGKSRGKPVRVRYTVRVKFY